MQIICPVDVKYKGIKHKAHTQFNCDSSDFQRLFQPLGAWAYSKDVEKLKEKPIENKPVTKSKNSKERK